MPLMYGFGYNLNTANEGVWLSGAAYCNKEGYPNMKLIGSATGFKYYETLYDKSTDLQGYTAVNSNSKQIAVV